MSNRNSRRGLVPRRGRSPVTTVEAPRDRQGHLTFTVTNRCPRYPRRGISTPVWPLCEVLAKSVLHTGHYARFRSESRRDQSRKLIARLRRATVDPAETSAQPFLCLHGLRRGFWGLCAGSKQRGSKAFLSLEKDSLARLCAPRVWPTFFPLLIEFDAGRETTVSWWQAQ